MSVQSPPEQHSTNAERAALTAVLESSIFRRSPGLGRLLAYICERYFEQVTDTLKEYSIAVDVFNRPETFDPAVDSIVRVEAHRLRRKLRAYYEGEGRNQAFQIFIATGQYIPKFLKRDVNLTSETTIQDASIESPPEESSSDVIADHAPLTKLLDSTSRHKNPRWILGALFIAIAVTMLVMYLRFERKPQDGSSSVHAPRSLSEGVNVGMSGGAVRIRCGYTRNSYLDQEGNVWFGDRYFAGGYATDLSDQYIAGTRDPQLYLTLRSGIFTYDIPAQPGSYELRLHFAETTFTPASTLGGGENSRVFNVQLNGKPLLMNFDIVSDGGSNTADVRVFENVHPDATGHVHLDFSGSIGLPILNAIELLPLPEHRMRTIRMVAQNNIVTDVSGNFWEPDNYFRGGRLAEDRVTVEGATDPKLYAGQRYGNFTYEIPLDRGTYTVTLYFAETYWGTPASGSDGPRQRVFDILCNGIYLVRNLDIAQEVGSRRPFEKSFHGLEPNPQGKLEISFRPVRNYAFISAIKVEEESP